MAQTVMAPLHYPKIDLGQWKYETNPRVAELSKDALDWLVNTKKFNDTPLLRRQCEFTRFLACFCPEGELPEKLTWVSRLTVLVVMADDIRDEKLGRNGIDPEQIHLEFVQVVKNLEFEVSFVEADALRDVLNFIRNNSPSDWYALFENAISQSFIFAHEEAFNKDKKPQNFTITAQQRIFCFFRHPLLYLVEFLFDCYLAPVVRSGAFVNYLDDYAVKVMAYCNDYQSFEKEANYEQDYGVMFVLKREKDLTYQQVVYEMKKLIEDNMSNFRQLSVRCAQFYSGDDLKNLQVYVHYVGACVVEHNEFLATNKERYPKLFN